MTTASQRPISANARFIVLKHPGYSVWTAVLLCAGVVNKVQCTCTCSTVCVHFHMSPFVKVPFFFLSLCVCVESFCFTVPLRAFPLTFSIYLSHFFLLNTFASVHLCPCPSFLSFLLFPLPLPFLAPVRLHSYSTSPPDK